MTRARYALTLVFDLDFMTKPSDSGVRKHFESAAREAVETYLTRTVTGREVVFVAVSRDSPGEPID